VEREIFAAEKRAAELEKQTADPELFADHQKAAPILAELTEVSARLPELNRRWEGLGTLLESAEAGP